MLVDLLQAQKLHNLPHPHAALLGLAPSPRQGQGAGNKAATQVRMLPHQQVVQDGHIAKQLNVLKRPRDAALGYPVWLEQRQVVSGKPDSTAIGFAETADTVKNGGFASAIRTDEAMNGSLLDLEGDIIHCLESTKTDGELLHLQVGHSSSSPRVPRAAHLP